MHDKRRHAPPQAILYMSAKRAVARAALALDGSNRDALEHINTLVHSGRLAVFGRELLDNGTQCTWQIEGEELRGARLDIDGEGQVRLLREAGTGVVGVAWWNVQILFRREDIDHLWPPPPESQSSQPQRRRPGPAPTGDWRLWFAVELIALIARSKGKVPQNDAKIARDLSDQFSKSRQDGWEPDQSDARKHVAQLLRSARRGT